MGLRSSRGSFFFGLFETQASLLVEAVALLEQILEAPTVQRAALRDQLHTVEQSGDEANHQIIEKINKSFVTPFDREDMAQLASYLDDCMDLMDEAADLLVLYRVGEIPANIRSLMQTQVGVLKQSAILTAEAAPKLNAPQELRDYWVEINRLENDGDQAYRKTLTSLFDSGIDPALIIKIKDIIQILEHCADAFEDLANCIESIAVKES